MGMLDKGMSHVLGRTEWDRREISSCYSEWPQFKTDKLSISGIPHLIFLDCY